MAKFNSATQARRFFAYVHEPFAFIFATPADATLRWLPAASQKYLMTSVHTEHLELRSFTLDDAEAYWPLVSDPEVLRHAGEEVMGALALV